MNLEIVASVSAFARESKVIIKYSRVYFKKKYSSWSALEIFGYYQVCKRYEKHSENE